LPDEFLIETHPIRQDYIPYGALVFIVAVGFDGDFFPKGEVRGGVLGPLAVGLALLRAVDAVRSASSARDQTEATEVG